MFRTGDKRKRRGKSVEIGKSSQESLKTCVKGKKWWCLHSCVPFLPILIAWSTHRPCLAHLPSLYSLFGYVLPRHYSFSSQPWVYSRDHMTLYLIHILYFPALCVFLSFYISGNPSPSGTSVCLRSSRGSTEIPFPYQRLMLSLNPSRNPLGSWTIGGVL